MTHKHYSWRFASVKRIRIHPVQWLQVLAYALVVAGGAKAVSLLSDTMTTSFALVGAWLMLTLGLAYATVRLRPSAGVVALIGFGIGALLVVLFSGMQMVS
ncbi:hypothetical protein [Amycolatopsis minnesotensis]|uniref:Uncharacterized protein n=1 Tax=Amycolatopsis minnesotensis TaxID=337894 RepID=A0ABN2SZ74_9PSEU